MSIWDWKNLHGKAFFNVVRFDLTCVGEVSNWNCKEGERERESSMMQNELPREVFSAEAPRKVLTNVIKHFIEKVCCEKEKFLASFVWWWRFSISRFRSALGKYSARINVIKRRYKGRWRSIFGMSHSGEPENQETFVAPQCEFYTSRR